MAFSKSPSLALISFSKLSLNLFFTDGCLSCGSPLIGYLTGRSSAMILLLSIRFLMKDSPFALFTRMLDTFLLLKLHGAILPSPL